MGELKTGKNWAKTVKQNGTRKTETKEGGKQSKRTIITGQPHEIPKSQVRAHQTKLRKLSGNN